MLSAEERLEQLEKVIDDLEDASNQEPIIVEGKRDVLALKLLGITTNVVSMNKGISIFSLAESMSRKHRQVIVLTDWDRRGGQLARMLKDAFVANGVVVNDSFRAHIVILSKKEIKDIESLPGFIERLRAHKVPRMQVRK
jgi:5S rRNA maturation endonuclease (ribonuclease M5)